MLVEVADAPIRRQLSPRLASRVPVFKRFLSRSVRVKILVILINGQKEVKAISGSYAPVAAHCSSSARSVPVQCKRARKIFEIRAQNVAPNLASRSLAHGRAHLL